MTPQHHQFSCPWVCVWLFHVLPACLIVRSSPRLETEWPAWFVHRDQCCMSWPCSSLPPSCRAAYSPPTVSTRPVQRNDVAVQRQPEVHGPAEVHATVHIEIPVKECLIWHVILELSGTKKIINHSVIIMFSSHVQAAPKHNELKVFHTHPPFSKNCQMRDI